MKVAFLLFFFTIVSSPSLSFTGENFLPEGLYGFSQESCSDQDLVDYGGVTVVYNKISSYELGECEIVDYNLRGNTLTGEWICFEEGDYFVSSVKITKKSEKIFELHDYYDLFLCEAKTGG
jgi:hypothetical protein